MVTEIDLRKCIPPDPGPPAVITPVPSGPIKDEPPAEGEQTLQPPSTTGTTPDNASAYARSQLSPEEQHLVDIPTNDSAEQAAAVQKYNGFLNKYIQEHAGATN